CIDDVVAGDDVGGDVDKSVTFPRPPLPPPPPALGAPIAPFGQSTSLDISS
ncbi:hypothetical protein RUM43_008276, partial [Polyplax serrata]